MSWQCICGAMNPLFIMDTGNCHECGRSKPIKSKEQGKKS